MRKKFSDHFYLGNKYKEEFRKQMRLIIVFALGFTIAFAWRETIFDLSKSFVHWLTGSNGTGASAWASVFITIICILLLLLTSHWLRDKNS